MSEPSIDLAAIRARAEAATAGPWESFAMDSGHSKYELDVDVITEEDGDLVCDMRALSRTLDNRGELLLADADFIANARADVPALLAEVERLREENAWLRESLLKQMEHYEARLIVAGAHR